MIGKSNISVVQLINFGAIDPKLKNDTNITPAPGPRLEILKNSVIILKKPRLLCQGLTLFLVHIYAFGLMCNEIAYYIINFV